MSIPIPAAPVLPPAAFPPALFRARSGRGLPARADKAAARRRTATACIVLDAAAIVACAGLAVWGVTAPSA